MGYVIEGVIAVGILVLITWAIFFIKSALKDRARHDEEARELEERVRRDAAEARLYQPNQPLRCMGCEAVFTGPLTEAGCPRCHLLGLVIIDQNGATRR